VAPRYRFEASNGVVVCQMAALGLGVALADPFVARSSPAPQMVMRAFAPSIPLPYGAFFPTWQPRSGIVDAFAALVVQTARHEADTLMRHLRRRQGAGTAPPPPASAEV
jgi:DNA-binding transcriptional LysR family regulator